VIRVAVEHPILDKSMATAFPIFVIQILGSEPVTTYGHGEKEARLRECSRSGTSLKGARNPGVTGAFNIRSDTPISNASVERLRAASGPNPVVRDGPPRVAEMPCSLSDISAARNAFGFEPAVTRDEILPQYNRWTRIEMGS
jgi:nucleoside-diphosphate-sugar epimerase